MSLLILERFGLMNFSQICATFDIEPAWFEIWKGNYNGHTLYDANFVWELIDDNRRLKRTISRRVHSAAPSKRKYSEDQIDSLLRLITCRVATPEQVCEMFGLSIATIHRWSASMSDPRDE